MISTEAIATLITSYFAATREMDVEAWLVTFAEDAVSHDPVGGIPLKGHAELRQYFQQIVEMFERVGLSEDFVAIAGNQVAVKWTGRGIGKNGREVTFEGIDLFEISDEGRIRTLWAYWDPGAMITDLQVERGV